MRAGAKYRESRRTLRKCTLICRANQSTILLAETAGTVSDAVGYSGSRVRMEALPSAGCIVGTASIPTVLFSPQQAFAKTSVEKAETDLPYKLGGTKIGSWGNLCPVGAPKEKPPYDQQFPKEPLAAKSLSSSETCAIGTLSRRASGLCGMHFPYAQAVQRHAGLFLFGTFSFKERKSTPFPLIKGKYFIKSSVCLQNTNILLL